MAPHKGNKPHYEFGGPLGVIAIVFGCPAVVYAMYYGCHAGGCVAFSLQVPFVHLPPLYKGPIFTVDALLAVVGWFAYLSLLYTILPCQVKEGVELADGKRLKYHMNGFFSFVVTCLVVFVGVQNEFINLRWIYNNYLPLWTAALMFSFALSVFVYVRSFLPGPNGEQRLLAAGGQTGSVIYDWFIGRELNPRLFGWYDIKFFCELRPGLMGWALLDTAMMYEQYSRTGAVTWALACVAFFQITYVMDALAHEPAILTTMDITTDGLGFMLSFALCWVPFAYAFQARYLVDHPVDMPLWAVIAVNVINFTALAIFRFANSEKNAFRTDPNDPSVRHLKYMKTEAGSSLLISGWWGMARHINYLGDWLQSWAFCLPTGFKNPVTYFYVIYFGTLLVHRELRDEEKCSKKYGKDWKKYCELVPYRVIPYVW